MLIWLCPLCMQNNKMYVRSSPSGRFAGLVNIFWECSCLGSREVAEQLWDSHKTFYKTWETTWWRTVYCLSANLGWLLPPQFHFFSDVTHGSPPHQNRTTCERWWAVSRISCRRSGRWRWCPRSPRERSSWTPGCRPSTLSAVRSGGHHQPKNSRKVVLLFLIPGGRCARSPRRRTETSPTSVDRRSIPRKIVIRH